MDKILNFKKQKELILICFLINIIFSNPQYETFNISIPFDDSHLDALYISDIYSSINKSLCDNWIPSLRMPILLTKPDVEMKLLIKDMNYDFLLEIPLFNEKVYVHLYLYTIFDKYEIYLGRIKQAEDINQCYFGLSSGFGYFLLKEEKRINLNYLSNTTNNFKKIFSFDKWILNKDLNLINTTLYFGDKHENFNNSNNGIIGSCTSDKNAPFWGCEFKKIGFNDSFEELKTINDTYYKIYFSSENHQIVIPTKFKPQFENITKCKEDLDSKEVFCDNFVEDQEFFQIKLMDDNMIISIEIDNLNRYINKKEDSQKKKTRIIYEDNDFFIFPLIMFKNFHVQFDANNYNISFYTTDNSILEIIKKEKNKKKKGSSAGTVFLVIIIIILIIALLFGIFWLIKKKRNSIESNINKYNKFEDEENFKDMNEKRVF